MKYKINDEVFFINKWSNEYIRKVIITDIQIFDDNEIRYFFKDIDTDVEYHLFSSDIDKLFSHSLEKLEENNKDFFKKKIKDEIMHYKIIVFKQKECLIIANNRLKKLKEKLNNFNRRYK